MRQLLSCLLALCVIVWVGVSYSADTRLGAVVQQGIAYKSDQVDAGQIVLRLAGGLVLVMVLAYIGTYVLKRKLLRTQAGSDDGRKKIRIIESKRITRKTILVLVQIDSGYILIAENDDKVSMLSMASCAIESDERNEMTRKSS